MAYAKKTCAECGWQDTAEKMYRVTHSVNSGSSTSGFTARNIAFSLLDDRAARKFVRTIIAPNKRTYKRNRTVWMCINCARNHIYIPKTAWEKQAALEAKEAEKQATLEAKENAFPSLISLNEQVVSITQPIEIEKVASGQKLIIYSILAHFLMVGLQVAFGDIADPIASLIVIVAIVMSLVGMFRLASGLGYSTGIKILLIILLLVPLVGLIALLVLNSLATKALRNAGYKVGLLGVQR